MAVIHAEIFHDNKELEELTGLTRDELFEYGFDPEDWNGGIRVKVEDILCGTPGYEVIKRIQCGDNFKQDVYGIESVLYDALNNFASGADAVKYGDYIYYMMRH